MKFVCRITPPLVVEDDELVKDVAIETVDVLDANRRTRQDDAEHDIVEMDEREGAHVGNDQRGRRPRQDKT